MNSRLLALLLMSSAPLSSADPLPSGGSLATQLNARQAEATAKRSPEVNAAMAAGKAEIAALRLEETSLQVGQRLPPFALPDHAGRTVSSAELLRQGPLVVAFYRGGWCPYCNLALKALLDIEPQLRSAGATLAAISPEKPDESAKTIAKNQLTFAVLTDTGNAYGKKLGIVFTLPAKLETVYQQSGLDLKTINAADTNELPYPATYVVDRSGKVAWRFIDPDYAGKRAEPADVLAAVRSLGQ